MAPLQTLDLQELAERATRAAQSWAPGCVIDGLEVLPGGTVSLVYTAKVSGGGAAHETVVLKVAPPGLPPIRNRDMLRQARVIDALGAVPGIAVPSVLFTDEGQPNDIPPFFVTPLMRGECVEPLLVAQDGPLPEDIVRARAFAAVATLVAARKIRLGDIGLGDEPEASPRDEVERWTRTLSTVPDDLRTGYSECAEALLATAPEPLPSTVIHGDFRLGNMLCEGPDIVGIIDWELWTTSDPRIDLSWLLFFTDDADHPSARHGRPSGMPSQAELLAAYEEGVGESTPDLDWFHALTWFKEAAAMALIAKHARRNDPESGATMFVGLTTDLIARAHRMVVST